jgi:multiple sugar transport system ATP-binding protein
VLAVSGNKVSARNATTGATIDLSSYGFSAQPQNGAPVEIGRRPEHFLIDGNGPSAGTFELPVAHAEKAGADATAFLTAGDQLLAVRVDPAVASTLKAGAPLKAGFRPDKLNVFDARTGLRM